MSANDYAPRSPDLSSFYAGSTQPGPQHIQHAQPESYLGPNYQYKSESPTYDHPLSFPSYPPTSVPNNHDRDRDHNNNSNSHNNNNHHHVNVNVNTQTHHVALDNLTHTHHYPQHAPHFDQPERILIKPEDQHYSPSQPSTQLLYSHSRISPTGESIPRNPQRSWTDHTSNFASSHLQLQQQPPSGLYSQGYGEQPATYPASTTYAQTHVQDPNAYVNQSQSWAPSGQPILANMPPRRAPPPPAPVIEPSPVRTKFPTARIKRIMQADEEVGKVAQQTPIAVGKALELFMIQLVSKSADVAKEKGSKRVTASMLKQVVETDEQWDFLRDIVGRVENEKEGKARAKPESSSDEEEEEVIPEPKKRTRGGRKKKAA